MAAWETLPDPGELDEDEIEEFLSDSFSDMRWQFKERAHHDLDGFFCSEVGDPKCLALGHSYNDDSHDSGWNGTQICPETKEGTACSACEGECDSSHLMSMSTRGELWALVSA